MTDQLEQEQQEQEGNPLDGLIEDMPEALAAALLGLFDIHFTDVKPNETVDQVYTSQELNTAPLNIKVLACKKHQTLEVYVNFMGADPIGLMLQDGKVERGLADGGAPPQLLDVIPPLEKGDSEVFARLVSRLRRYVVSSLKFHPKWVWYGQRKGFSLLPLRGGRERLSLLGLSLLPPTPS